MAQQEANPWEFLPPSDPGKIWVVVDANRHYTLTEVQEPRNWEKFTEMTLLTVTLETIVINDRKDLDRNAEVAVIAQYGDSLAEAPDMMLDALRISDRQAGFVNLRLIGPRFWTDIRNYDFRLALWEIDQDIVSSRISRTSYQSVKDVLRGLTGSGTSSAVTPHETVITSAIQPVIAAIARHFEKPDPLFRSRFEAGTVWQDGHPAFLPLRPGRYLVEFVEPGRTGRRLTTATTLNRDYSLQNPPPGRGHLPNYVIIRVETVAPKAEEEGIFEQQALARLEAFRARIRDQASSLLPPSLKKLFGGTSPTDELVARLELADLKKRYGYRRTRTSPVEALRWFVSRVESEKTGNDTPILSTEQLRDTADFLRNHINDGPVVDSDSADRVFMAWSGFVGSDRDFEFDSATGKFRVTKGLDSRCFDQMKAGVASTANLPEAARVPALKEKLKLFLMTIEDREPRTRLTTREQTAVLERFRTLFAQPGLLPPEASGSAAAQASTDAEWLNRPWLHLQLRDDRQTVSFQASRWTDVTLTRAEKRLDEYAATPGRIEPELYEKVLRPVFNALASTNGEVYTNDDKERIVGWLRDHTVVDLKADEAAWRKYFADRAPLLLVEEIGGRNKIRQRNPQDDDFKMVQVKVAEWLRKCEKDPNFNVIAPKLIDELKEVTRAVRAAEGEQEKRLVDLLNSWRVYSKEQYLQILGDSTRSPSGMIFHATFRGKALYSSRGDYYDPLRILASLNALAGSRVEEADREGEVFRAIAYLGWDHATLDSRIQVYDSLVRLTDFATDDASQRYSVEAWQKWWNESRPVWNGDVNKFVRTVLPTAENKPPVPTEPGPVTPGPVTSNSQPPSSPNPQ